MAITKVMGIETEYGITVPGAPDSNPVLASSLLVNAFSGRGRKVRWDYEEESPLRDARGFEAAREPKAFVELRVAAHLAATECRDGRERLVEFFTSCVRTP